MRVEPLAEGVATDHFGMLLSQFTGQYLLEGGGATAKVGETAATTLEQLAALLQQPLLRDGRRIYEAGRYTVEQRSQRLAANEHGRVK
eukprot:scaffold332_cov64-Phaeocystis_antarctica.AAC.4